ncbi:g3991 [Coccomyxa elongata]
MEVEVPPPPSPPPSGTPMEWASPSSPAGRRLPRHRVGDTAPASDMDCDEPAVATDHTAQQRGRPNSEDTGSHTAQPHTSSLVPLELSGVPSTRIEECLAWLTGHTHFDPAQTTAALRSLYDQQPLMLLSGDTFTDCEARHDSLCDILRRTHGASSLPRHSYGLPPLTAADLADRADGAQCTAAPARQRQRPAIPPGFEPRDTASLAAQHAAQVALTGLPAVHRSARVSQRAGKWWTLQPPQQQEHRNRNRNRTEGSPGRRPYQP